MVQLYGYFPPSFTKKNLSKFYNSTDLQRQVSLTSLRVLLRRILVNSTILRDCSAKFHLLTEEGSGMVSSVAIVPRTTSIRVRDSPCILASPSTTRQEIPWISCDSSTPSPMKQQGPPRPAQRRLNSSHQPSPGFQHEDARLHDDKSEPNWS